MFRTCCRIALVHLASIVLAVVATVNVASADFNFRSDTAVRTRSLSATVRIFAAETSGQQLGSGFVIDSSEGLILTAAHVVSELKDFAWVVFPKEKTRHRVRALRSNGVSPTLDLAVLKLDPALGDIDSLELQFEKMSSEQDHGITGYGRSSEEPQEGTARPSLSEECLYTMRGATLYGDSGSAVLTVDGLVDGIAVDGAESGGGNTMAEMKVLPLSCAMSLILDAVPDVQSEKIIATIAKGSESALRHAFQPPPKPGWVSNLRLAKALQGWIAKHKSQRQAIEERRLSVALEIIVNRHLGFEIAIAFTRFGSASEKNAADALQQFAHAELGRGSTANAERAYAAAQQLYTRYASVHLPDTSGGIPAGTADIAAAYKGVADTLVARALISGKKQDLNKATSFAAAAVLYAPRGKLKAESWATLGTASQEAGEVSVAVPAYQAALDQGAPATWVAKDLLKAKSTLGQRPQADLTAGYFDDGARAALTNIAAGSPEANSTLKGLYKEFGSAVGKIEVVCARASNRLEKTEGTFFLLSKDGYALTAAHLFGGESCQNSRTLVKLGSSASPQSANLVTLDREHDLALIKLPEGYYKPAKLSQEPIASGEPIAAFGFPTNQGFAATMGAVAPTNTQGGQVHLHYELSPGFSGGPVFDSHGQVTGVAIANPLSSSSPVFVPIELAKPLTTGLGLQ